MSDRRDVCPGCGNSLRGGRFTLCPSCGFDLKANKPGIYAGAPSNQRASTAPPTATSHYSQPSAPPFSSPQFTGRPPFSLKDALFSFRGRLNRAPYIWLSLGMLVFFYGSIGIIAWGASAVEDAFRGREILVPLLLFAGVVIAAIWINIALGAKRLHDMGMSGTHMIWITILNVGSGPIIAASPVAGIILWLASLGVMLWLWCTPGTNGSNRYGPPLVLIKGVAQRDLL